MSGSSPPEDSSLGAQLKLARDFLVRFFTAPTDGRSAGLFRILFGLLSIWTAIGVGLNLHRFFGNDGMIPWSVVGHWEYAPFSFFHYWPESELILQAHFWVFLVAAVALTLGVYARPAAFVIYVIQVSLEHRNAFIINSGDRLYVITALYAALMPLSDRYSLTSWWRTRSGRPDPAPKAIWSLRLVQLQIAYVYFSAAFTKLNQERWISGYALRDVLASPLYAEWPEYVDYFPIAVGLTWGTLVFELVFPSVVWFKRYRPWAIIGGVLFHLGIDALMLIPMFSYIMTICYAAYLTDDETGALLAKLGIGREPATISKEPSGTSPKPKKKKRKKKRRRRMDEPADVASG